MTVAWQIAGDSRLELGKVLFFFFSPKKLPLKIFEWAENERKWRHKFVKLFPAPLTMFFVGPSCLSVWCSHRDIHSTHTGLIGCRIHVPWRHLTLCKVQNDGLEEEKGKKIKKNLSLFFRAVLLLLKCARSCPVTFFYDGRKKKKNPFQSITEPRSLP